MAEDVRGTRHGWWRTLTGGDAMTTTEQTVRVVRPGARREVVPSGLLGMVIFVGTEVMFFAGLISAFTISKAGAPKDAWNLPAIRVTYKDHPDDLAIARFLQDRGVEILEAAGAQRVGRSPVTEQDFGLHLLGTCRMGNDPHTSVVDKYHRAHDVPNLFVCDGSSLVTSGRGQPTMTIQALAFRAGEHIAGFAKRGEI